ncbi:putative quinol monooxygenase [Cryobacterium luteum]|uniref:Antibiotic biosynthesis monooxygenase n=1 Tax=Cryobacterium luteum TaxID=1424661 RepID=A0A1H8ALX9_9MICO|nr:antibiotic biosynthesis monooxygenase [Cryobacterium luteum]TFB88543.1 antibiotic biosynthesis monooxygenase [Cryobacterium luteum]SEM70749.1 Quinol monooxygenase YgiN [Cryobacterium luteum]
MTGPVIALYAEFTALPGHEKEVSRLLQGLTIHVRQEAGCIRFDPHRLGSDPAAFFVYEEYRDPAAFDAHRAAAYGAAFNLALAPLVEGDGSTLTFLAPLI